MVNPCVPKESNLLMVNPCVPKESDLLREEKEKFDNVCVLKDIANNVKDAQKFPVLNGKTSNNSSVGEVSLETIETAHLCTQSCTEYGIYGQLTFTSGCWSI